MALPPLLPRASTLSARMARWGVAIVLLYVLAALVTPLLVQLGWLPEPNAGLDNPIYASPSAAHWCGTDRLGRDVCVRTLAASGVALQVVVLALVVALVIGVPLGMVSGYLGGGVDRVLVLLMDTLYTLPVLLLSVVLAFLLGRGLPNAAAALCVVYIPQYFRVVRNQSAQVKAELYVEAAQSLGAGPLWILRRYLLRNVITSVPVLLTLNAADGAATCSRPSPPCPPASGGPPSTPAWPCSCWCWASPSWGRAWRPGSVAAARRRGPHNRAVKRLSFTHALVVGSAAVAPGRRPVGIGQREPRRRVGAAAEDARRRGPGGGAPGRPPDRAGVGRAGGGPVAAWRHQCPPGQPSAPRRRLIALQQRSFTVRGSSSAMAPSASRAG
jgi:peptide/nickel transport system permease protein